jgi:hypothetical protein
LDGGGSLLDKDLRWGREKWRLAVAAILFAAALSSLRNAPLFMIVGIPVAAENIRIGYENIKKDKQALKRAKQFYLVLALVAAIVFIQEAGVVLWQVAAGKGISYPVKAVEFLKQNNFEGRLFSNYGWGGYLIWKLPGEKVFIDGRMPSWRWKAPTGESDWALKLCGIEDEVSLRIV